MLKKSYAWKFSNVGGETRVNITDGSDIAHLEELDQKMWTVLSCPVKGLEIDEKTLQYMDKDNDEKIRVNEVLEVVAWLKMVLADLDILLHPQEELPLSCLNLETEEGKQLYASAKQILANLELQKKADAALDAVNNAKDSSAEFEARKALKEATDDLEDGREQLSYYEDMLERVQSKKQVIQEALELHKADRSVPVLSVEEIQNLDAVSRARMMHPSNSRGRSKSWKEH